MRDEHRSALNGRECSFQTDARRRSDGSSGGQRGDDQRSYDNERALLNTLRNICLQVWLIVAWVIAEAAESINKWSWKAQPF